MFNIFQHVGRRRDRGRVDFVITTQQTQHPSSSSCHRERHRNRRTAYHFDLDESLLAEMIKLSGWASRDGLGEGACRRSERERKREERRFLALKVRLAKSDKKFVVPRLVAVLGIASHVRHPALGPEGNNLLPTEPHQEKISRTSIYL